jgi:hypothetical protein
MIAGVHYGQISQRCASIASPLSSIAGGKNTTEEYPLLYDEWVRMDKTHRRSWFELSFDTLTLITNFHAIQFYAA